MIGSRPLWLLLAISTLAAVSSAQAGVALPLPLVGDANDRNGTCVDISGNTILVGGYAGGAAGVGWAQAFVYDGGAWQYQQTLESTDPALTSTSRFGYGLGLDGNTAVIGAYGANKVYVFNRSGTTWSDDSASRLQFAGASAFGFDTRIDGSCVVVGAYLSDSAHVFTQAGGWDEGKTLPASGERQDFGYRVDLSADRAIVGDVTANTVHYYRLDGDDWVEEAVVSRGSGTDQFGTSVAIDGDYAIVGANQTDASGSLLNTGSATIYHREGATWAPQATLAPTELVTEDRFGTAVALWGDTAVVGATGQGPLGGRCGSVYVFKRIGSQWVQCAKLRPDDGAVGDQFGNAVAIEGDWIVVGAWRKNSLAGAAYVFATPSVTLVPGDANFDGKVNEDDAAILAGHWGTASGLQWTDGDFTGDGAVDAEDASILAANWRHGVSEAAGTVPEPGGLIALAGLLLLLLRRRRL